MLKQYMSSENVLLQCSTWREMLTPHKIQTSDSYLTYYFGAQLEKRVKAHCTLS